MSWTIWIKCTLKKRGDNNSYKGFHTFYIPLGNCVIMPSFEIMAQQQSFVYTVRKRVGKCWNMNLWNMILEWFSQSNFTVNVGDDITLAVNESSTSKWVVAKLVLKLKVYGRCLSYSMSFVCVPNGHQTDECGQTTLSRFLFHTSSALLWLPMLQDLRSIYTHLCKTCRCDLPVIFECPFPHLLLMLQLAPSSSVNSS